MRFPCRAGRAPCVHLASAPKTQARVRLVPLQTCRCSAGSDGSDSGTEGSDGSDSDAECKHAYYWHLHLESSQRRPATAKYPWERARTLQVQYGRLLLALLGGLPTEDHSQLGNWLAHHKRPAARVKVAPLGRIRINDDSTLPEWELRGPHTAHHNRSRRRKRRA